MALKKELKTEFGVTAGYWRIARIDQNFSQRIAAILMEGYADKEARQEGARPLETKAFALTGELFTPDIDREQIYTLLKSSNQDGKDESFPDLFIDSEDA